MMRWGIAEHWAGVLGKRSQKLDVKEYDHWTHLADLAKRMDRVQDV